MGFHFVNNNLSHTMEKVVFNGTEVEKVRFNGQLVFVKYIPVSIDNYDVQGGAYNENELVIYNPNPYSVSVALEVLDIDNMIIDEVNEIVGPKMDSISTIFNTSNNEELTLRGNIVYYGEGLELDRMFNHTIYVPYGDGPETNTTETVRPDTNTQTMSLTKAKAVSSEGNFTLYQGGENK